MEPAIRKALLRKGTLYKDIPGALVAQLESVAEQHGLDAQSVASAFDKFMTTSRSHVTAGVSAEDLEAFTQHYAHSGRVQPRGNNLFDRGPSWEDATLGGLLGGGGGSVQPSQRISPYLSKQPPRPASAPKPRTPASTGKFRERALVSEVLAVLNPQVAAPAEAMEVDGARGGQPEVEALGRALAPGAKYMVNRLEDRVEHLESRIVALESALESRGVEVHCVSRAAQEQAVFVGRICCDTEEGRLNAQSTLLEGSMRHSGGARVRLDLSKCPAYRLFPGQVVAVHGANPSGHCIVASEVVGGLPLPMQRTSLQQLAEYATSTGEAGLSVVVAAGPFTAAEDCEYEPLAALLEYCASRRHGLLLLLGPFVDAEHPAVRGGMLDETFDDLFHSRVVEPLEAFCAANPGVRVVLQPSVRDAHHHPVFPQQPLSLQGSAVDSVPSPATLRCNEVVVGCTSSDWLLACSSQEISRAEGPVDRLPTLAAHVLAQRNYMPLYPPPAAMPLDSSRGAALELPCTPDVLVLPSDLQPFAKLVTLQQQPGLAGCIAAKDTAAAGGPASSGMEGPAAERAEDCSVVCINPGRLAKGAAGGTFAHLYIAPLAAAVDLAGGAPAATNGAVLHQVGERCRVEIRRV